MKSRETNPHCIFLFSTESLSTTLECLDVVNDPRVCPGAQISLQISELKCWHAGVAHLPGNYLLIFSPIPQLLPLLSNKSPFSLKIL